MYKKLCLFLTLILLAIVFAACATPQAEAGEENPFDNRHIEIAIDSVTGCEYVVFDRFTGNGGAGGITPRLTANGKPICPVDNIKN